MAVADPNIGDRTPGTWTYFAKSTGYGEVGETLEYMGRVAEEPSLNIDADEYDYNFSGWRYTVNDVGHMDESIDLTVYPQTTMDTLKVADVVDETTGERKFNIEGDYRVQVMREAEDTAPAFQFGARNVHWYAEEVSFDNGPLTMSLTGQVNGGFDFSPPPIQ